MFVMRPASAADQEPIAAMIRARSAWMRRRGIHGWDGWESSAEVLAAQAADPSFPVWVMTGADGGIAGCTSLYEQSPPWFWTEAEQAESAFFLATTVTDPALAGQRAGALMSWSVLDLAARTGRRWVRRGTTEPALVAYHATSRAGRLSGRRSTRGSGSPGWPDVRRSRPDFRSAWPSRRADSRRFR
jgi:hypothetical protein